MARLVVADDTEMMRDSLASTLRRAGYDVAEAADGAEALRIVTHEPVDLLLTDLRMPGLTGMELLQRAKQARPELPVVLMTAYASVQTAVEAMKHGAYDYLQKPFEAEELLLLIARTLDHARLKSEHAALRLMTTSQDAQRLVGDSPAITSLRQMVIRLAGSDAPVLVRGESGTGKNLVASLIHAEGARKDGPLVTVPCAMLASGRMEAELFGDDTGTPKPGRFELAAGGTLVLDEVAELPLDVQPKLLRVLAEGLFERVGGTVPRKAEVRVIATTSRRLESLVEQGAFRRDLLYRLNVLPIDLPSLRDHADDLPDLCRHLLHRISRRQGTAFPHMEPAVLRLFNKYNFPGNVRELANLLERAALLDGESGVIKAATIEPWVLGMSDEHRPAAQEVDHLAGKNLADIERQVILSALRRFHGHRAKTAHSLGIGIRTLGLKIKRWKDEGSYSEAGL